MRYAAMLIVGFAAAVSLAAQGPLAVTPGQRVRLTFDGGRHRVAGVVVSQDSDAIAVRPYPDDAGLVIAQSRLTAVEVSTGRHSNAGTGALIGLVGGGLLGAAAGASCEDEWLCPGPAAGAASVGLLGAALGGLIGAFSHSETWQPVDQRRVRVSVVAPARGGGLGVGVAVRF